MSENKKLSEIYRFLALSISYPESNWLNDDYLSRLINILETLEWQEEADKLREFTPANTQTFEDLQVEYTRLFISAVGGAEAPPYGSVYLSDSGMLFNEATEEVHDYYRQKGFQLAGEEQAADHISNELEFLALLTANDMLDDEQEFLEKYFRPWFSQFQDKVIKSAQLPYYVIIAKLISFFTMP